MNRPIETRGTGAERNLYPLYSAKEVAEWPGIDWLVDGVIQQGSAVLLYGESRIGKSFLALDLAVALAAGNNWFGYPVRRSRVIFFAAESPAGLRQRLCAHRVWNSSELPDQLSFMRSQLDLSRTEDIDRLIATIQGKADVLVVDTFNAASAEVDENSSREIGRVLNGVRRIVSELGCTVIFVHHCGWSDHDRPRGHSSLAAAMDTRILVTRESGHPSWRVRGQREGADTEPHKYALREVPMPDGSGSSCAVEPLSLAAAKVFPSPTSKNQKVALRVAEALLASPSGCPLTLEKLIAQTAPELDVDERHRKERATEAIRALLRDRFLTEGTDGSLSLVR